MCGGVLLSTKIKLLQFFDRKETLFRGGVWVNDNNSGGNAAQFACVNRTPCIETREERLMTF